MGLQGTVFFNVNNLPMPPVSFAPIIPIPDPSLTAGPGLFNILTPQAQADWQANIAAAGYGIGSLSYLTPLGDTLNTIFGQDIYGNQLTPAQYNFSAQMAAFDWITFLLPEVEAGELGAGGCPVSGETSLFRAVNPSELSDIIANGGAFRNLGSGEGKYFSTTLEGAASYARQTIGTGLYEGPYTIIQSTIPSSSLSPVMGASVDGGIPAVVVPNSLLPSLSPGSIIPYIPIK